MKLVKLIRSLPCASLLILLLVASHGIAESTKVDGPYRIEALHMARATIDAQYLHLQKFCRARYPEAKLDYRSARARVRKILRTASSAKLTEQQRLDIAEKLALIETSFYMPIVKDGHGLEMCGNAVQNYSHMSQDEFDAVVRQTELEIQAAQDH